MYGNRYTTRVSEFRIWFHNNKDLFAFCKQVFNLCFFGKLFKYVRYGFLL